MAVDILFIYDKDENFIGTLSNKNSSMCPFFADDRYERLDNTASTLEFKTLMKHRSGIPSRIENEGFVVFCDRDGKFVQYKIIIAEEDRTSRQLYVLAVGSWIELTKEMIEPFENVKLSAKQQLDYFLRNTRWRAGQVAYSGVKTMSSDKMMTVLEATQRLRTTFKLEPRFRIEMGVNGEITGRYCDLLEHRGIVHPNRFEIGKDVQLLRRKIDTTELVTALYGYGQQAEGANVDAPLDFSGVQWSKSNGDPTNKPFGQKWVGSDEALAKYGGKDKKHKFGVHESTVQGDANSLLQHTWEVLQRRSIPKVTYEVDLAVLGDVGIGDTINIVDQKDDDNELYLEARVLELEGPVSEDKKGKAILGNYRELQKVDITEILQDQLRKYATNVQLQKEVEAAKTTAINTASTDATNKANSALSSANTYTNNKDTALRNGLNTGAVAVNASGISGMINAGKIDVNLTLQTHLPGWYTDDIKTHHGFYHAWSTVYKVPIVFTYRHEKRYITIEFAGTWAGMWEGELSYGTIIGGRCDYAFAPRAQQSDIYPGSTGSFTNESTFDNPKNVQVRSVTIDLGTPDGTMKTLIPMIKGNYSDPVNFSYVLAFIRFHYVAQHD